MPDKWWWQVDIDGSDAALLRFARAVLTAKGTWSAGGWLSLYPPKRGVTVFTAVELPAGTERAFVANAKPQRMVAPTRPNVGGASNVDDGHPGRAAGWYRGLDPWKVTP